MPELFVVRGFQSTAPPTSGRWVTDGCVHGRDREMMFAHSCGVEVLHRDGVPDAMLPWSPSELDRTDAVTAGCLPAGFIIRVVMSSGARNLRRADAHVWLSFDEDGLDDEGEEDR